jgi:hypothetical protein
LTAPPRRQAFKCTQAKALVIGARFRKDETKSADVRCKDQENAAMLIFMLAAAMTVVMLIATLFGLYEEAQRQEYEPKRIDRFGFRR